MAYNDKNLAKLAALESLATRIEAELTPLAQSVATALKSGKVDGNTVSLYTSADKTGAPAFTFDFPVEMFLDQAKTAFISKFTWTAEIYPGSADPGLNGKPVMALAVKGDNGAVTYSFLDMAALVDTYKPKATGKDASTTVTVEGYEVEVKVNISAEADNQLQFKKDGLYVPKPAAVDLSGKTDKVSGAAAGNFAALDADGNLTDSGKKPGDFSKVEASGTAGAIKVDGVDVAVVGIATDAEVKDMLDKVFGVAAGS